MTGPGAPLPRGDDPPGPPAVRELFSSRFGGTADGLWFAPGRANLMGEHTDYNEGYVLPFALGQGVAAAAARRADRRLVLCSAQEPGPAVESSLDGLTPGQVTGTEIGVEMTARRPGDPAVLVASSERIQAELGWRAERDLRAIAADAWEFTQARTNR